MKIPSAFLILLFLCGCGGSPTDLKAKEYKGRLEDRAQGLAFQCPEKWEIRENVHGHRAIGRSPRENPKDAFQENVVVSGPLTGTSAEEVLAASQTQLAKELKGYKQLSATATQLDFVHEQQGQKLRCRQLLHPHPKGGFWVVTFSSSEAEFARWEPEFGKIWASFGAPLPAASATPTPAASPPATPAVVATPAPVATPVATPRPTLTPGASSPSPKPVQSPKP